ncbi:hypothetical protein SAMN03159339_4165 [Variovorax sp. 770b2]|nr:hypothetical protein SAMN03159339_4165 [Variovorax sp. 770b2]
MQSAVDAGTSLAGRYVHRNFHVEKTMYDSTQPALEIAKWKRKYCQSVIEGAKKELEIRQLKKAVEERDTTIRTILSYSISRNQSRRVS